MGICQSILREKPDHTDTLNFLAVVAHQTGKHAIAIDLLEKAIRINHDVPDYYNNCGEAYRAIHKFDLAIARYEQAIAIKPDYAEAYNNYGNALQQLGRLAETLDCYHRALAIRPDYAEAHHNLAAALQELGQIDEAISHYEEALVIKPDYANARRHLVMLAPRQGHVPIIEKLLSSNSIFDEDAMHLRFALAKVYEANDSYDLAFENYHRANVLKRKTVAFDSDTQSDYIDRLIETCSEQFFRETQGYGLDSTLPVFVVGMPRSGTTLVEQIISSHPDVYGAGELRYIASCERMLASLDRESVPYPECMQHFNRPKVRNLAEQYLNALRAYSTADSRIVDKMPDNFLRLGLIKTLFPNARVIHCRRNALDTCLSIYFQYFQTSNGYAFDLEELGQYYLDYERLMRHWRSISSPGFFEVEYEDLVTNQEAISRQLIEHLDLEWDDQCLEFYKNDRPVRTSSVLQVRQPMYTDSINKWKKYENHLGPLISILQQSQ